MIDIVYCPFALLKINQIFYDGNNVIFGQGCNIFGNIQVEFNIHPVTADISKIVSFWIEEQPINQIFCRVKVGGFTRTQLRVNCFQCIFRGARSIFQYRVRNNGAWGCIVSLEQPKFLQICFFNLLDMFFGELCIFIDEDFTCFFIKHIATDFSVYESF